MPSPKSPQQLIHEAIVAILTDGAATLAVDGRDVRVISHLPDEAFAQSGIPLVAVEFPELQVKRSWDNAYDREEHQVVIELVDAVKVGPDDERVTKGRLAMLMQRVRALLKAEPNLRLAYLHVYESHTSWEFGPTQPFGNNLMAQPAMLTVPCLVEKGKVWET